MNQPRSVATWVLVGLCGCLCAVLMCFACGVVADDVDQDLGNLARDYTSPDFDDFGDEHERQRRQATTAMPAHQYKAVPYYDPSIDRLSQSESRLIKNVLIPAAANFLSRAIRLNGTLPITITQNCNGTSTYVNKQLYCDSSCGNATKCGPVTVPNGHLKGCYSCAACTGGTSKAACCRQTSPDDSGVMAHLLLYVSAIDTPNCQNGSVTVESRHCEQEHTLDRPIAGYINFCRRNISSLVHGDYRTSVNKVLHYLIRILAFNFDLFGYFQSPTGVPMTTRDLDGLPFFLGKYLVSDLTVSEYKPRWPLGDGKTIVHSVRQLITPTVKREVQAHFSCGILDGAELEQQPTDPSHGQFSLFEERLFHLDIMSSGQNFHSAVVSRITLAVLQDSGWYQVDMSVGEELRWGKGRGCGIATQNCLGWTTTQRNLARSPLPFCTDLFGAAPLTCSNSHNALARCNLEIYPTEIPAEYQYFSNYTGVRKPQRLGGRNYLADYCPMVEEFMKSGLPSRCDNPASATVFTEHIQHFGPGARCATHVNVWIRTDVATKSKTLLSNFTAGCYQFACYQQRLSLLVGGQNYTCDYGGEYLTINVQAGGYSYTGTIICPRATDICEGFGCPEDCSNNGACDSTTGTCQCRAGYFGVACNSSFYEMWQDCASSPCINSGSCVNSLVGYVCACPRGFTGSRCELDIDDCLSKPCLNNGVCVDSVDSFLCQCASGYTGITCQTDISFCLSFPCKNNGSCTAIVGSSGKTTDISCQCPSKYDGDFCEKERPSGCSLLSCRFGTCVNATTKLGAACQCFPGYTGFFCNLRIDYCMEQPCQNGATCSNAVLSRNCSCTSEYYGDSCENKILRCNATLCRNGGSCTDSPIGGVCTCRVSHTGRYCDQQLYCYSQPCLHNSTCSETPGVGFNCSCSQGYIGTLCEINYNECGSSPCRNGATCIDHVASYSCKCNHGFTGYRCEVQIDECVSQPCANNGHCIDRINGYLCNCSSAYKGAQCQTEVDECLSGPCKNGATCRNLINAFKCMCAPGFTGVVCSVDVDECSSSPCNSTGTAMCVDGLSHYSCVCKAGYNGHQCAVNINECRSSPCRSGTCTDAVNGYTCTCFTGFTGVRCETNIDDCKSSPCKNGALCKDAIASVTCQCAAGYTGAYCEHVIPSTAATTHSTTTTIKPSPPATGSTSSRPSSPSPQPGSGCVLTGCSNSGKCNLITGMCSCPSGFAGDTCTIVVSGCQTLTCLNGGTCSSYDNGLTPVCLCPQGFTGAACESTPCLSKPCGTAACHALTADKYECVCLSGTYGPACTDSTAVATDHCRSAPCMYGGTCTNFGSQFACKCPPGLTGYTCETNIDECLSSPCKNNGLCEDAVNGFTCLCPNGVSGPHCEVLHNVCLSNPCLNGGQCVGGNGRYTCLCTAAYTGNQCQVAVSKSCEAQNCRNGATCVRHSNGTVSCICVTGYDGDQCAVAIHACSSSPCLFGGECIGSVQAPDWFLCNCTAGYHGDRCETPAACFPNPCQNGGECGLDDKSPFDVDCRCTLGYAGEFCEFENDPCSSSPCAAGSICSRTVSGAYRCTCAFPTSGDNCRSSTDAAMYAGKGFSIVRFSSTSIKQSSLDISLSVMPLNGEGLLLAVFWGDDQTGDFLALALVGGRVNVRYQIGGRQGAAVASKVLAVDAWQTIGASISGHILLLTSNDTTDTHSLQVTTDLSTSTMYVGGTPDKSLRRTQFGSGFYGCVASSGMSSSVAFNLAEQKSVSHFSVQSCHQTPCARLGHSCTNGGSCVLLERSYACSCPLGFGGLDCSRALSYWRPQFQGISHLSLQPVGESSGLRSKVELVFRPAHADGLLLLGLQENDGVGDFLSLSLSNGFVYFRFDCGGGPIVIHSVAAVSLHQWHNVTAWREGHRGSMVLDGGAVVSGDSQVPLQQLDLLYGLYVGGHPSHVLPPIAATVTGMTALFQGCIAALSINDITQDITSSSKTIRGAAGMAECGSSSLCSNPCQTSHRGTCRRDVNGNAVCVCPLSSGGPTCTDASIFTVPAFSGTSYLSLDAVQFINDSQRTDIVFRMRPTHVEGTVMVLSQGDASLLATDYIWLWMHDGKLNFQMDLGSGRVRLTTAALALNTWHQVEMIRDQSAVMLLADKQQYRGTSPGAAIALNDATQLYLGGTPPATVHPYGLGTAFGFQGCIDSVQIGKVPLSSLEMLAMEAEGVGQCQAPST